MTRIVDTVSGTINRQYDIRFDTVTQEVTPLGASTATVNYQYDSAGRRTQMQLVGQAAVTYGYDAAGQRFNMGGTAARINLPPALGSATYDAGNRLTNFAGSAPELRFQRQSHQ